MKRRRLLQSTLFGTNLLAQEKHSTMTNRYWYCGGTSGPWRVSGMRAYRGIGLKPVERVEVVHARPPEAPERCTWILEGFTSNVRYATREEVAALRARQEGLGRPQATCAALIPIKKSPAWWEMAQDERRRIFEETSHHTSIGLEYLPAIARRLHHCRDLGGEFDFLTWFEFAPQHKGAFEELVSRLRSTKEWEFVEREVDIRLVRA
jgi:hypothetical protein